MGSGLFISEMRGKLNPSTSCRVKPTNEDHPGERDMGPFFNVTGGAAALTKPTGS